MGTHYITVVSRLSRLSGPGSRAGSAAFRSGGLLQLADLTLEIGEVLEALVDRRESQVRDRIEHPEMLQHGHADAVAWDLGALGPQLLFDLADHRVEGRLVDARGGGPLDPGAQLGPVEGLGLPRPLAHDHRDVLDALVGGE